MIPLVVLCTIPGIAYDSVMADDVEYIPIPLDRETLARLARFARAIGKHPTRCAAELLHDLMRDDEFENINFTPTATAIN